MYPTDLIYPVVFNFTDTDSPIEHFEELGYEGANYVDMSGSLLINILITIVASVSVKVVEKLCIYFYKHRRARMIGSRLQNQNFLTAIVIAYMQGFLELSICIVVSNLEPKDGLYKSKNISDIISASFSLLSILILCLLFVFLLVPLIYE